MDTIAVVAGFFELRASPTLAAFFGAGALICLGGAYYIAVSGPARAALGLWMAAAFGRAILLDARCVLWIPWARARWAARIPCAVKFDGDAAAVIRFGDGGEARARLRGGFCAPLFSFLRIAPTRGIRRIYVSREDGSDDESRRRFRAEGTGALSRAAA